MGDGELLGKATLELDADLAPLTTGLDRAEKKVAEKTAAMQAVMDRLHFPDISTGIKGQLAMVDLAIASTTAKTVAASEVQVAAINRVTAAYLEQAAAARAAGVGEPAIGERGLIGVAGHTDKSGGASARGHDSLTGVEGVRGRARPGSRANPLVVVIEAGKYTSLGALAAGVAENSGTQGGNVAPVPSNGPVDSQGRPVIVGAVTPEDRRRQIGEQALATAVQKLTEAQRGPTVIAPGGGSSSSTPRAAPVVITGTDQQTAQRQGHAIGQAVATELMSRKALNLQARALGLDRPEQYPNKAALVAAMPAGKPDRNALEAAIAIAERGGVRGFRGQTGGHAGFRADSMTESLFSSDANKQKVLRELGLAAAGDAAAGRHGSSSSTISTPAVTALMGEMIARDIAAAGGGRGPRGGGGGGGGGGGVPPWLAGALWGSHGGGGGRPPGWLGYLLAGGGAVGAKAGTAGSFAGFGAEHILLTAGGIAGSGAAALGGGALLGAGALGKFAVGAGSDAAVLKSTITDTKSLQEGYDKVLKAQAEYGKGSKQAVAAQKELNQTIAELGNTAGTRAELGLAKQGEKLNAFWNKQTSGARVAATKVLGQFLELAKAYIPLVAHAAEQNLTIINKDLKPLMKWISGPEGMGIFLQLESEFKSQLPTALKALTQGFEFFAKTVAYTAPLTGRFVKFLSDFFTRWNKPGAFSIWEGEMNRLINDFHVWGAFVKILGKDIYDLFRLDAHTGQSIIETLTGMLTRLDAWEKSTKGSAAIKNIFLVHKEEVIELLKVLPPLLKAFTGIYTTVSPPLVKAVTQIANVFAKLLNTIESAGPLGTWAVGLTIIAAKLKVLTPLLGALKTELFGVAAAESEAAAGATALAAGETAAAGGAGLELAGGGGVLLRGASGLSAAERANLAANSAGPVEAAGLLSKGTLLKAGAAGAVGLVGGSVLASATGAKGTLGTSLQTAGAGAGIGLVAGGEIGALGGPLGAVLGAGIGAAAPYVIKGLTDLFSSGTEKAVLAAHRTANAYLGLDAGLLGPAKGQLQNKAFTDAAANVTRAREAQTSPVRYFTGPRGVRGAVPGPTAAHNAAAVVAAERHLGEVAGKAYVEGFQHVRFPTRLGVLTSIQQHLDALPKGARGAAAKTMLQYAAGLEAAGRLPKGSVQGLIVDLERKFSGLAPYLASHGAATSAAIIKAFQLQHAKETVGKSLLEIEGLFGVSFKHTETGTINAIKFLQNIIKHNKGPLADAARQMLSGLAPAAEVEWAAAREVNRREMSALNSELNHEIGELGGAEIKAGFHGKKITGKKGSELPKTPFGAVGGLIQIGNAGEAGHDTVGLNVGGMPIAVAPGEQVAVFNRHQLPIVNEALAGVGGLEGLFSTVNTPHYMASGGFVAGPGTNYKVGEEPRIAKDLQRLGEYLHVMLTGISGYRSPSHSVAVGGYPNDPHTRGEASDTLGTQGISAAILAKFGLERPFPGSAEADHMQLLGSLGHPQGGVGGMNGGGGAPAPTWHNLKGRHVPGKGFLPKIVNAALAKAARQANAYGKKKAGSLGGHGTGGHAAGNAQMRAWAKAGLQAAGLPGTPSEVSTIVYTMSHESGGNPHSENTWDSNAKAGHPSRGLMELIPENFATYHVKGTSNNVFDPVANVAAAVRYMIHTYGHIVGMSPYARGGLVGFSGGTHHALAHLAKAKPPKPKLPKASKPKALPKSKKPSFKKLPKWNAPPWLHKEEHKVNALIGESGLIPKVLEEYELAVQHDTFKLSGEPHEGAFIVTAPDGTLQIDQGNVNLRVEQLHGLYGQQGTLLADYNAALAKAQAVLSKLQPMIEARQKHVRELRAKIEANIKKIKKKREEIEALEHQARVLGNTKKNHAATAAIGDKIAAHRKDIRTLEEQNHAWGGNNYQVGGGGRIGEYDKQIKAIEGTASALRSDVRSIAGASGKGGAKESTEFTREELNRQLAELGAAPLNEKLAEGQPAAAVDEASKAQLEERNRILQAEKTADEVALKVFGGPGDIGAGGRNAFAAAGIGSAARGMIVPFGGSFAAGGIVPGPVGAPVAIVAHGGEEYMGIDGKYKGGGGTHQHFHISTLHPGDPATLTAIGKAATKGIRYQGLRLAKRTRPGI